MTSTLTNPRIPLIATADPALREQLLRLAAAGGARVRVATGAPEAAPDWPTAPFVVLGADLVVDCVRAGLVARPGVTLIVRDGQPEPPWRHTEALKAERVAVLPAAEPWLVDCFTDFATGAGAQGRVVAVLGGRGGAGASVFAAALAITGSRRGFETLLVDADPLGGGVDLVLGWERMDGLRWSALADARGRLNPPGLVRALPGAGGLAVLSFDRSELHAVPVEAMAATLDAGRRGRDLVVVDLPRRFDEACLLALHAADQGYLVVPADMRAVAAAQRLATAAVEHCADLALVVRGPLPSGLTPEEMAHVLGLPLAGTFRSEPRLGRTLAGGVPPAVAGRGPLADLCGHLLSGLEPRRHRAVPR